MDKGDRAARMGLPSIPPTGDRPDLESMGTVRRKQFLKALKDPEIQRMLARARAFRTRG
jgi:hypothetical protein